MSGTEQHRLSISSLCAQLSRIRLSHLEAELASCDPVFDLIYHGNVKAVKVRLEGLNNEFLLGIKDKAGWSLLHYAVFLGHLQLVDLFVSGLGLDVDLECNCRAMRLRHWRPIHVACERGNAAMITRLLELGANAELFFEESKLVTCGSSQGSEYWTPLHLAAITGSCSSVEALLKSGSTKGVFRDPRSPRDRVTPLMLASEVGHAGVVNLLVKAGADVNARSLPDGMTPLLYCVTGKCEPEVLHILLSAGADPTLRLFSSCLSPLHSLFLSASSPSTMSSSNTSSSTNGSDLSPLFTAIEQLLQVTLAHEPDALQWTCTLQLDAGTHRGLITAPVSPLPIMPSSTTSRDPGSSTLSRRTGGRGGRSALEPSTADSFTQAGNQIQLSILEVQNATPFVAAFIGPDKPSIDTLKLLIENGADINSVFDIGKIKKQTVLHHLISHETLSHDMPLLDFILEKGVDINAVNSLVQSPLIAAAQKNLFNVVQRILSSNNHKLNLNQRDSDGGTALMYAVKQRNQRLVTALLDYQPPPGVQPINLELGLDFTDKRANRYYNCTPLQMAVGKGCAPIVELLVQRGANINAAMDASGPDQEECCVACLHTAVVLNHVALGELLMDKGISPDVMTSSGHTPLVFAASWGHLEFAKVLIKRGASVNPGPSVDYNPLIYAAKRNNHLLVKLLLDNGADPNTQDKQGYSALHWALNFAHNNTINILLQSTSQQANKMSRPNSPQLELTVSDTNSVEEYEENNDGIEKLTEETPASRSSNVLNVNLSSGSVQHRDEVTPVVLAVEYCEPHVLSSLLSLGANPNSSFMANDTRLTPIFLCAEFDSVAKMKLLIDYGADINSRSSRGETPLHFAIRFRQSRVAELLIRSGAQLDAKASVGNGEMLQPIHVASQLGQDAIIKLLVQYGASLNCAMILRSVERVTPLHVACLNDRLSTVVCLVEMGCEVNCIRSDSFTPLLTLVSKSNYEGVKMLLEHGADVNSQCVVSRSKDATCLHMAAQVGCLEIVKLLIDYGADMTARMTTGDRTGILPLLLAAESGHLDVIKVFLEVGGMSVDTAEDCGLTCLHYAANSGKDDLVKYLLHAGADVNARANFDDGSRINMLPIHMASEKGHETVVRLLLAHGSPINATITRHTRDSISPLYLAVSENQGACVSALIAAGADVNLRDSIGAGPLIIAIQKGYTHIFHRIVSSPGVNVNLATNDGVTPLHIVAEKGHNDMALRLIRMGADVNAKCLIVDVHSYLTSTDITPLNQACGFDRPDIARMLIRAGAELYSPEVFEGESDVVSIHCAAIRGRLQCLNVLVEEGIDIDFPDASGRTALHWAALKTFYDFVVQLLHHGANPNVKDKMDKKPFDLAETSDIRNVLISAEKQRAKNMKFQHVISESC